MTLSPLRYTPYFACVLTTRRFGQTPVKETLMQWKERSGWKKIGRGGSPTKIGSTNEVIEMLGNKLMKLIIAITKMIEARTTHIEVNTEFDKVRMKDFRSYMVNQGLQMSDDPSSWPDDFEEDWE